MTPCPSEMGDSGPTNLGLEHQGNPAKDYRLLRNPSKRKKEEVAMTRMLKVVMLVSLAVGLLPRQQASGQVAQQKSARKLHPKQELKWESLGEGVQVLRLWKSSLGPEEPQIAVLG